MIHTRRFVVNCVLAASLTLAPDAALVAPIVYTRLVPGKTTVELWRVNPDGTGDQRVPVNLVEPDYPSFSRDGRLLALTSISPLRPNQISRDVFLLDTLTGALAVGADFQDQFVNGPVFDDTGRQIGVADKFTFSLPFYKALSPDNSRMVISTFTRSGYTQGQLPPTEGASGMSTVPILQVYRLADGFPQELLHIGRVRTGFTLGGFGIDWHPTQNLIACTVDTDTAFDERPDIPAESSAIFLLEPVNDPVAQGRYRKLTFPRASITSDFLRTTLAHQTDYAPAFSPDGTQLAYLRGTVVIDTDSSGITLARPVTISLRMVNLDGTGDHSIFDFNPGLFVNRVSWSPTGTQLVFDVGRQPAPQPLQGPPLIALPESLELIVINSNGSGFTRLLGPGTGNPAWSPRGVVVGPPITILGQPQDETVPADGNLTLTVNAIGGRAPLTFQWRRNGIDLPGANGPTLTLQGIPAGADADFAVAVSDGVETVVSRTARVTVTPGPNPASDASLHLVRLAAHKLKLSWTPGSGNLRLQSATVVGVPETWNDVPPGQTQVEGNTNTATFDLTGASQFFRLIGR